MPAQLETPIIAANLKVTAIIIDAQSTEYTVAAVICDADERPMRNVEVRGRVVAENGVIETPPGLDFQQLYADLKVFAYWALNENGYTNTVDN